MTQNLAPAPAVPPDPAILPGLAGIARHYDVILSDIWGVLHDGTRHFPAAADALAKFRAHGGKVVLITNAPRPKGPIIAQLDDLGVPHNAYDDIVTSGDATLALIAERVRQSIYHIGPQRDLALFETSFSMTGIKPELRGLGEADYVVCTGLFDDDHEVPEDYRATLETMLARNMPMVCANPDIIVHRADVLLYCSGALAQMYQAMGGATILAGKPYAPVYEMALKLSGRPKGRVLAIGDAMATDMLGARGQNIDGLFVTNGIHRDVLHRENDVLLPAALKDFLASHDFVPRYAINHLRW